MININSKLPFLLVFSIIALFAFDGSYANNNFADLVEEDRDFYGLESSIMSHIGEVDVRSLDGQEVLDLQTHFLICLSLKASRLFVKLHKEYELYRTAIRVILMPI